MEQENSHSASLTYDMIVNSLEGFVVASSTEGYSEPICKRRLTTSAQPKVKRSGCTCLNDYGNIFTINYVVVQHNYTG